MGAQVSKSETYVKEALKASTNVVNQIISNTSTPLDMNQIVSFEGCSGIDIGTIDQSQTVSMDVSAALKALQSTDTSSALKSAVTALAQAEAEGGLGLSVSATKTVVDKSIALSAAVQNVAVSNLESSVKASQGTINPYFFHLNYISPKLHFTFLLSLQRSVAKTRATSQSARSTRSRFSNRSFGLALTTAKLPRSRRTFRIPSTRKPRPKPRGLIPWVFS